MFIKEANKVYFGIFKIQVNKTWICVGYSVGKEINSGLCNLYLLLLCVLQRTEPRESIDRLMLNLKRL